MPLYTASTASRWLLCPGSAKLSLVAPERKLSAAAERGTAMHAQAASALLGETPATEGVDGYVREIEQRARGGKLYVELDLSDALGTLHPDLGGTADAVIVKRGSLTVVDLKTGRLPVPADSPQLLLYLLGARQRFGRRRRYVSVVYRVSAGAVERSVTDRDLDALRDRILAVLATPDRLSPGGHCRYCPAMPVCPALRPALDTRAAPVVTAENAAAMLRKVVILRELADRIEAEVKDLLEGGAPVRGVRLVPRRPRRVWADEKAAAEALDKAGVSPYTETVMSPAQAEKVLGRSRFDELLSDLVVTVSSGMTVVADDVDCLPLLPRG